MLLSELPFQNVDEDEFLNSVVGGEKIEFDRYNDIKFDVIDYNEYLENTSNDCIHNG